MFVARITVLVALIVAVHVEGYAKPEIPDSYTLDLEVVLPDVKVNFAQRQYYSALRQRERLEFSHRGKEMVAIVDFMHRKEYIIRGSHCTTRDGGSTTRFYSAKELFLLQDDPKMRPFDLNLTASRGVLVDRWVGENVSVPFNKSLVAEKVTWDVASESWIYAFVDEREPPVQLHMSVLDTTRPRTEADAEKPNPMDVYINVFDIEPGEPSAALMEIPPNCRGVDEVPALPDGSEDEVTDPMVAISLKHPIPSIPSAFSAYIEVNMRERMQTFMVEEHYDGGTQTSATRVAYDEVLPGSPARRIEETVYVYGAMEMAVLLARMNETHIGRTSSTCERQEFGDEIFSSVGDLFLVNTNESSGVLPRYMGHTVVRGIEAQWWEAWHGPYRVRWYFSTPEWNYGGERRGNTSDASIITHPQVLLRVDVAGYGRSPFFVHHPFSEKGDPLQQNQKAACKAFLGGFDSNCDTNRLDYFHHVYEVLDFQKTPNSSLFQFPQECRSMAVLGEYGAFRADVECPSDFSAGALLLIIIITVAFTSFAVGFFVYLRIGGID